MSPVTTENVKESGSPMTSPPATPLAAVNEIDGNEALLPNLQTVRHGPGRRRTVSLTQAQTRLTNQVSSRCDKEDTRPNTPVDLPYEVFYFLVYLYCFLLVLNKNFF